MKINKTKQKKNILENNQKEIIVGQQVNGEILKNNTDVSILYTNADQFLNKRDDLAMMIVENKPDIILITEVIPKSQSNPINPSLLSLDGYNYHLNFNLEDEDLGKSGIRGVIIYYKDSLVVNEVMLDMIDFKDHVWIEVMGKSSSLLLGCIYRSPSDESTKSLIDSVKTVSSLIEKATNINKNLVIAGDFNLKDINWNYDHSLVDKDYIKSFIRTLHDNYLTQHITEPTRYRVNQESNILDLVISSKEEMIQDIQYLPPLGNSDHICLRFSASFERALPFTKNS